MTNLTDPTARIVYVEDEPSIAQLLVSGLSLFGIEVHPLYASAEELLNTATEETFKHIDLFFFDIRLPKMTGLELAKELRKRGEKRPFVLVSAWPSPSSDELEAISATFLPKPFDFPDVIKTIQSLLNKS
ncbi:MAG: response regulator [Chloroflexota bacterium]